MGFWVDLWLHDIPDTEFDADGKQIIIRHLCFGPLTTRLWYKQSDGQYCCKIHFIEGFQDDEQYTDLISTSEMLRIIETEIDLCKKHGAADSATLLQVERENILMQLKRHV